MIIQHPESIDIPSDITLPDFVFGTKNIYNDFSEDLDSDAFIDGDTGEKITHRAVVTTINPMYTEKEVSHQLKDSNAKMIFTFEKWLGRGTKLGE
ncbi:hypothetical protein L0F63_002831 [Massospora cicadina]|nr:hypothetical protein L0F63_002831 [Massospora cicadina]